MACYAKKLEPPKMSSSLGPRVLVNKIKRGSEEKIVIGAVDIGGTKIAVGMVDDTGRVLSKLESPTDAQRGYSHGLKRMIGMLRETARVAGVEISGIGIGSTGLVYPITGAFGDVDFLPGWQGNNPVKDLSQAFNVTAALENDADASALGEASWGAGKGKSRLVYVTVRELAQDAQTLMLIGHERGSSAIASLLAEMLKTMMRDAAG